MKKKTLLWISLIVIVAIGGYFVWNSQNKKNTQDKEVIKIGAILPLTGEVATYGQDLKKGIDIAFEEEPNFKVFYQDSKAQANTGLNAMLQLRNSDKIEYFIGDATTTVSLVIAEEAQKNRTPLIVPIASGNEISKKGDYVFMNCPRNEKQSMAAAKFIVEKLGFKKIGIIYQQISYGIELSEKFISELQKYGIKPIFNEGFQEAKTDLKSIIIKAKAKQPEIVFIPMEYESAALVLKQAKEQGLRSKFCGTDGAYSQKLTELAGSAAEGFYFTMFPLNKDLEYYKVFEDKFKSKYNSIPNVFTCYGYETAKIMIEAIKKSNNTTKAVKHFLYNHEFDSFTGKLKYNQSGEAERNFGIIMVDNNNFIFL